MAGKGNVEAHAPTGKEVETAGFDLDQFDRAIVAGG